MPIKTALADRSIEYQENFPTSKISSVKAGGNAEIAIFPTNITQLTVVVDICLKQGIPYKIIGGCTNTCFSDRGFNGAIIWTGRLRSFSLIGSTLNVECGISLAAIQRTLLNDSVAFVPDLFGIPGRVGGALRNNAGAFLDEISNGFLCGEFFDTETRKTIKLEKSDLDFSYRHSLIGNDLIFLSGTFKVTLSDKESIKKIHSDTLAKRIANHPKEPSLGSFFKRTENGIPASKLIDEAGLKGYRLGGAAISDKHAGFIVNRGDATVSDIEKLALYTESKIKDRYGIILEREAEIVLPREF